ncbi:hypothetical protein [Microlunatus sp. GCM10028923]|uniref:hypothetical protein n=1 Tax=Microlunatus sp. GCM10028923 TaxID=3273400 RepID=UPI003606A553
MAVGREDDQYVPGATRTERQRIVTEWLLTDLADVEARDAVTYGAVRPSALETALRRDRRDPTVLFADAEWVAKHLEGQQR